MISQEVLEAIVKGCAVEFEDALGKWQIRCLVDGEWCMPVDGKGWVPCMTRPNLAILLGVLSKYEWRRYCEQRDWKGALEWLKEGKFIRRASWCKTVYVKQSATLCDFYVDGTIIDRSYTVEDFEATDWELA
jgi:hypothetical protein